MLYAYRIIPYLCLFTGLALCAPITFELHTERNKTMNTFLANDINGNPVRLEWKRFPGNRLSLRRRSKA